MSQKSALINTLKRLLKQRGITYKEVASSLELSEASVKRLFSKQDFSLQRLDDMCKLLDIEISDLSDEMLKAQSLTSELSFEQESLLVSDIRLLMLAQLLMDHWNCEQILQEYDFEALELVQYLASLDKLKIIDLYPNNRVKLKISRDFSWLKGGPIEQFFKQHVQSDFLNSNFNGPGEIRIFQTGLLSKASHAELSRKIKHLSLAFEDAQRSDEAVEFDDKYGTSMVIAMRPWKLAVFEQFRR
jgi:DNA-binding Xre family transcriptional regulator